MDKGSLGARNQIAQERIIAAVRRLTDGNAVDPALLDRLGSIRERDKAVQAMKEREVIADILEAVVEGAAAQQQVVFEATLEGASVADIAAFDAVIDADQITPAPDPEPEPAKRRGKGK